MNIKNMDKKAKEIADGLKSTDKRFKNSLKIINNYDGSFMFFDNAFAEKYEEFWFIFTEHHGYRIYYDDEIKVAQYKRIS